MSISFCERATYDLQEINRVYLLIYFSPFAIYNVAKKLLKSQINLIEIKNVS